MKNGKIKVKVVLKILSQVKLINAMIAVTIIKRVLTVTKIPHTGQKSKMNLMVF